MAQSHTPCNRCVRFATAVASGHATLATKRALPLTWAGLSPAGSHQLAAGARSGRDARFIAPPAPNRTRGAPPYAAPTAGISEERRVGEATLALTGPADSEPSATTAR